MIYHVNEVAVKVSIKCRRPLCDVRISSRQDVIKQIVERFIENWGKGKDGGTSDTGRLLQES